MSIKLMMTIIDHEQQVLQEMTEALAMHLSKPRMFDCCGDPSQQIESMMQHVLRGSADTLSKLQAIENDIRMKSRKDDSGSIIEGEVVFENPSPENH
ncbi:MAG TPA: hypothetical protein P5032_06185 [Candidatus Competibacter sp.]|nr:hypothetical protein [Candidatus Competibacteraceae bacterium]HRW65325.1 hypothetical protein [Candidatus Competibacter sp.]